MKLKRFSLLIIINRYLDNRVLY